MRDSFSFLPKAKMKVRLGQPSAATLIRVAFKFFESPSDDKKMQIPEWVSAFFGRG